MQRHAKKDAKKGAEKKTHKYQQIVPKWTPRYAHGGAKTDPWASTWAPGACQNGSRKGDWHHQGRQESTKDPPRSARNPPRTLGDRIFMIFPLFHTFFKEKNIIFTVLRSFALLCFAWQCFALICVALNCCAPLSIIWHCFALISVVLHCLALLCIPLLCVALH